MNSKYFAPFVLVVSAMLFGFVFLYAVLGPAEDASSVVRDGGSGSAPADTSSVELGTLPAAIPAAVPGIPPAAANPGS